MGKERNVVGFFGYIAGLIWHEVPQVGGNGRWASVSFCSPSGHQPDLGGEFISVQLYSSDVDANNAKARIDKTRCCHFCGGADRHHVFDLLELRKRYNADDL